MYEQISILGENIQAPKNSKIKKFEDVLKEFQQVIESKNQKIAYLEDRNKELQDKIQVLNTSTDKETVSLNTDKAKFLIGFLQLYKGNFIKFRSINEDAELKVSMFIQNIIYELGDRTFPRDEEDIDFNNLDDVKDLIRHDYSYLNF